MLMMDMITMQFKVYLKKRVKIKIKGDFFSNFITQSNNDLYGNNK